ncbi:MAG: NAD-dependent epimerase/dehydratase family protein, partial [Planctomycetota bacterium]
MQQRKNMIYDILVTGGAGYLGSVLVPQLLKLGHRVTVLDNFMFAPNSLLDCCHYNTFEVVRGDARERALIEKLASDKDIIIPLAA